MSPPARKGHKVSGDPPKHGTTRTKSLPKVGDPIKVDPDENKTPRVLNPGDSLSLKRAIKRAKALPKDDDPIKVGPDKNKTPRVPIPNTTSSSSDRTAKPGVHDLGPANLGFEGSGPMTSMLDRWRGNQSTRNR